MENAVQVLSRLPRPKRKEDEERLPDLKNLNMQGFDLTGLTLRWADLSGAQLQRAYLSRAEFDASTDTPQITQHLHVMFGDRSVILPEGVKYPDHWAKTKLDHDDFQTHWRAWQRRGGFDPENPQ